MVESTTHGSRRHGLGQSDKSGKVRTSNESGGQRVPVGKKSGLNIAFGTDQLLDASKAHQQSDYLVRLGKWFTPYEALKIATSENTRLLEMSGPRHPYQDGPLGVVQEGAYADTILFEGNPLKNLDLMGDPDKNFVVIMKDGKIYKNTLAQ